MNVLPAPIITIEANGYEGVYIDFDSVNFFARFGKEFSDYFKALGFDWQRLAGAQVLEIDGQEAYSYVDYIANTVSGNFLDHGVRVNSVFTSYGISENVITQRLGDLAGPIFVSQTSVNMTLVLAGSQTSETIQIPYLAGFQGSAFSDSASLYV